jgi:pimeloyl-ACP methyl ester carboxylesterase
MKRIFLILILLTFSTFAFSREYKVYGPQGGLAMEVTLPEGFNEETDKCPMVILMHGIFSSKDIVPIPSLARSLAKEGIASICFDFGGHWKSEGKMEHMTVGKEIEDALAIWEYVKSLPYVSKIGLLGHSQGGVVASMTAGILASRDESPAALVLVAPGSVIQDACKSGKFFGAEFDPADPPEYVKCFGIMKLGREYILSTQEIDIYGTAKAYTGPVKLIHGSNDTIVPLSCSEKFVETYNQDADLTVVEGENHMITRKLKTVVSHAVSFFASQLL